MIFRYCSVLALVLLLCGWAALDVPCSRRAGRLTQHRISNNLVMRGAPRAVESMQPSMQPPSSFHHSLGYTRPCASPTSNHPLPSHYYRPCLYPFAPQSPCTSANPSPMELLQPVWGPVVTRLEHPLVLPIMHGNFSHQSDGRILMRPSVTLIIDEIASKGERHHILVDTGLSLYTQFIIDGLRAHGVLPSDIDTVVITHGDTDTMANLNVFRCADVYSSNRVSREGFFSHQMAPTFDGNRSDLPFHKLFDNTELYLTPGFGLQDHSLVVKNVEGHGTVAIVGKLVLNETDLTSSNVAIREFAVDDVEQRKLWQATRREIVCLADYIVPGLGTPFKVTSELKRLAECPARYDGLQEERSNATVNAKSLT